MNSVESLSDQNLKHTYSVARGYDEVVSTREEPEVAVLYKSLVSSRAQKRKLTSSCTPRSPVR